MILLSVLLKTCGQTSHQLDRAEPIHPEKSADLSVTVPMHVLLAWDPTNFFLPRSVVSFLLSPNQIQAQKKEIITPTDQFTWLQL